MPKRAVQLFFSYAPQDEALRDELETHLASLKREGVIETWHDRKIDPGWERDRAINRHLNSAQIILLLISADFINSDYRYGVELTRALERHHRGETCVIPVILRPVDWQNDNLEHLQALPRHGQPITRWPDRDEAFREVAAGIRAVVEVYHRGDRHWIRKAQERLQSQAVVVALRPRNETLLLQAVKEEVTSRLKQSLHNAVLLNLGKEAQPEQVKRPWDAEVKIGSRPAEPLPEDTTILEVFEQPDIGGKLLILGAPGSGKTTTMLDLAQALIENAEVNNQQSIPILVNLSSWKDPKQKLEDWLITELKSKYGVRQDIGRKWLQEKQLLPLLDGLDEVKPEYQESCVKAINQWLQSEDRPMKVLVCTRREEYGSYETNLNLNGAIVLQCVTDDQLKNYLASTDQTTLWSVLHEDVALMELVRTPLLLSMTVLSYPELSIYSLKQMNSSHRRLELLLDAYLQTVLHNRINSRWYSNSEIPSVKQTRYWLIFLARQLQKDSQTEFLIEKLQPDWLQFSQQKLMYLIASGLILGLLTGLVGGLNGSLTDRFTDGLGIGLVFGLIFGLLVGMVKGVNEEISIGLLYGLIFGMLSGLMGSQNTSFNESFTLNSLADAKMVIGMISGIFFGLIGGMSFQLSFGLSSEVIFGLIGGLSVGLSGGLIGGVVGGIIGGFGGAFIGLTVFGRCRLVAPIEIIRWSWKRFFRSSFFVGFTSGLIGGISGILISILILISSLYGALSGSPSFSDDLITALQDKLNGAISISLLLAASSGLILGLASGFSSGLSGEQIEAKFLPNQGIRKSVSNFIYCGIIFGLVFGLIFGLSSGFIYGLIGSIVGVFLGALSCGGTVCIQHVILRILLFLGKLAPWNYARFLDYCTERLLLQRVGGRYRFIHKLLQDHFAAMPLDGE